MAPRYLDSTRRRRSQPSVAGKTRRPLPLTGNSRIRRSPSPAGTSPTFTRGCAAPLHPRVRPSPHPRSSPVGPAGNLLGRTLGPLVGAGARAPRPSGARRTRADSTNGDRARSIRAPRLPAAASSGRALSTRNGVCAYPTLVATAAATVHALRVRLAPDGHARSLERRSRPLDRAPQSPAAASCARGPGAERTEWCMCMSHARRNRSDDGARAPRPPDARRTPAEPTDRARNRPCACPTSSQPQRRRCMRSASTWRPTDTRGAHERRPRPLDSSAPVTCKRRAPTGRRAHEWCMCISHARRNRSGDGARAPRPSGARGTRAEPTNGDRARSIRAPRSTT